jgi:pyrimidine operon attenuation protein/uracil phosphoribosyltransferase
MIVADLLEAMSKNLKQYLETNNIESPAVIGIRSGGVWVAEYLHKKLACETPMGELDISFYRDDFTRKGLNPMVKPSSLPFETEGKDIILVDDVIMSGRTIRAAMNEIFDYGRPARIILVSLVDMGNRELPIQPDCVGQVMALSEHGQVKLLKNTDGTLELKQRGATK